MTCYYCQGQVVQEVSLKTFFTLSVIEAPTLCSQCAMLFTKLSNRSGCPQCLLPGQIELCNDCQRWRRHYPALNIKQQAFYAYNSAMKEWVFTFKFKGDKTLAMCFANEFQTYIKSLTVKDPLIIPIPLSPDKLARRGFNQVEALLEANQLVYDSLLVKKTATIEQSLKTREERLALKQPFSLAPHVGEKVEGRHVILVDDVYTTGRTLYWAAVLLRDCHPASIQWVTLAR